MSESQHERRKQEERRLLLTLVIGYIRDHGPCPRRDVVAGTGIDVSMVKRLLEVLKEGGHVVATGIGGTSCLEYVCGLNTVKTAPSVQLKPERHFVEPGPVITGRKAGVPYTYQGAPRGRFAVDLKPGTGAISQDNPRLAALAG